MRFTFVHIIRTIIFGEEEDPLSEDEKKKIIQTLDNNLIKFDLNFKEVGEDKEEEKRVADSNDINFYLNESPKQKKKDLFGIFLLRRASILYRP